MSADEHRIAALKIEYIVEAMKLVDSFAHLARKSVQAGNSEAAEQYRLEAEHFYSQAAEMLSSISRVDTNSSVPTLKIFAELLTN